MVFFSHPQIRSVVLRLSDPIGSVAEVTLWAWDGENHSVTLVKVLTEKVWILGSAAPGPMVGLRWDSGGGSIFLWSKMVEAATSEWI